MLPTKTLKTKLSFLLKNEYYYNKDNIITDQ